VNPKFIASMGIAIVGLVVGFILLYDIQQEREASKITPESLNSQLDESNERLKIVKDDYYNGKYNGDLPINEVIHIIKTEVQVQKNLLEEYKSLPNEEKTDKTIDTKFFQLGKYSWAGEDSMLRTLEKQTP